MIDGLKDYTDKIASSKKESREFLVRAGIVNQEGKLTEPYKNLCIR